MNVSENNLYTMNVNGKIMPVRGGIKENDEGGEFKYDVFDIL
jgi:hypothetical protein